MPKVLIQLLIALILLFVVLSGAAGQPVLPSDLKKPKKYENKKLGAEKSAEKKFTAPRKFIQNTVTHYNWYFNANNKLSYILENAKQAHRDDYSDLLTFYNYSLDITSANKTELDSVIYKANMGILTHDLRNAWIDNLFMLLGKAYYFRKDLDSAYLTFQYVNYAFSPKEADGYDMPIGSNANEGTNALSVSTKENNSLVKKAFSTPPSRNESFIWQIKTYLADKAMAEAASLIQTLKQDPLFPERLLGDLNEVQAHWFYIQAMYDSSALYLTNALGNAGTRQEKARWEYLIAQMYQLAKKPEKAVEFYDRARKTTLDPLLEIHSILNAIRQNSGDSAAVKKNVEELKKMGRKDNYSKYRDIIFYTAAQIELDRNNIPGAIAMLEKSTAASVNSPNPSQRTRSFVLLAELSFQQKNFREAKRYYDSVNATDQGIADPVAFDLKKGVLQDIVLKLDIISRQDSLRTIAAMPEAQREAFIRKLVRQLRKRQGLQEDEEMTGNAAVGMNRRDAETPDLFSSNAKGEWYFNNPSLKSKGFTAFRQTWGNRPNADNWRRQDAITKSGPAARQAAGNAGGNTDTSAGAGISYEALLANIPLTPEQVEVSEDSVANAMLDLGIMYVDRLEDYTLATDTLEQFRTRYPYNNRMPEALYYLYYCYRHTGNNAAAGLVKSELDNKFTGTTPQRQIDNAVTGADEKAKAQVTRDYEQVYTLFIEGSFTEALREKKRCDSLYGSSYWTPQLLYIESVYYMQTRQDEEAKKTLENIISQFSGDPMAEKAALILEVLGKRREIEDYLTKLEIKREEDTVYVVNAPPPPREQVGTPMEQDSTTIQPIKPRAADTLSIERPVITAPAIANRTDETKPPATSSYTFNVEAPHAVMLLLRKVDPVYVTESRNAFNRYNQEKYYNRRIEITNHPLNDTLKLVSMTGFENAAVALEYMQKTSPLAATQIVPWLPPGKLSFMVISEQNLDVLKTRQDMDEYARFHERYTVN